jgi:hypothetical protein
MAALHAVMVKASMTATAEIEIEVFLFIKNSTSINFPLNQKLNRLLITSFKTNCIRGYDKNFGNPKKIEQTDETSKKPEWVFF